MTNRKQTWLLWSCIIIVILFISAVIYAIFLYMDLNDKRTAGYNETTKEVLNQTTIEEITSIEKFNGEEAYHVIYGVDNAGEEKIIFYPLDGNEKTLTTINAEDVMSTSDLLDEWKANCDPCKLINVTPALIKDDVLWELTYYDENDRYVFDYVSIYDGSAYEEIRYLRMFN